MVHDPFHEKMPITLRGVHADGRFRTHHKRRDSDNPAFAWFVEIKGQEEFLGPFGTHVEALRAGYDAINQSKEGENDAQRQQPTE